MVNVVVLDKPTALSLEKSSRSDHSSEHETALIEASWQIYQTFIGVHPDVMEEPLGIAIDRYSYRGKLIFNRVPALLPQETFIPFDLFDR